MSLAHKDFGRLTQVVQILIPKSLTCLSFIYWQLPVFNCSTELWLAMTSHSMLLWQVPFAQLELWFCLLSSGVEVEAFASLPNSSLQLWFCSLLQLTLQADKMI